MNTALLIVDIQNDYFPGGKMELIGSPEAARRAASLLAFFRQAGLPVVFAGQTGPAVQVHAAFLAALNSAYGKVLSAAEIVAQLQTS